MTAHLDEETLNLCFDGELEPSHERAAQTHLEGCADCMRRYQALERLRELVLFSATESAEGVDFGRAFAHIERETRARPALPWLERMKTLVQELTEHKPARVFVPAVLALAAAAFLLLSTRKAIAPSAPTAATHQAPQGSPGPREQRKRDERLMLATAPESEVVQVDFGENAGTVFEIALADGASTPVVWINDEE